MAVNKNSVSYMKEYLKYAVIFEKYVKIWSGAMDEVNVRMKQIYTERTKLEELKQNAQARLASLDSTTERQRRSKEYEADRYRRKAKTALTVGLALMAVLFLLGSVLGQALLNNPDTTFAIPRGAVIPVLGVSTMLIGSIFTGIAPICLVVFLINKQKAKQYDQQGIVIADPASVRRQEMLLRDQEQRAVQGLAENRQAEIVVSKRQEEIHRVLLEAKENRRKIYAENVLHPKFHNLTAVATMYEYLLTGQCNTIQGHGGIIDTYKTEQIQLEQLAQMYQMNERLNGIENNQRYIMRQLDDVNDKLSDIRGSVFNIEKKVDKIERNTAISAEADKQTAAATSYMAWRVWANGY